ncbi:hypothetical protein [Nocardioides sp. TF02-7]|uniref:hypothetical protein n=1 Tax=Nocardioides sp. TF02-7 TaxID=2917724 RepID=UPI001F053336|nr:hypothetical protein [Nocardioides sp. TF02-7]UMG93138.1 hypothetical protein MF408_02100 [Nocardioides sp. TF02-7]
MEHAEGRWLHRLGVALRREHLPRHRPLPRRLLRRHRVDDVPAGHLPALGLRTGPGQRDPRRGLHLQEPPRRHRREVQDLPEEGPGRQEAEDPGQARRLEGLQEGQGQQEGRRHRPPQGGRKTTVYRIVLPRGNGFTASWSGVRVY